MTKLKIIFSVGFVLLTTASVMSQTSIQNALVQEASAETENVIYLPYDCDDYGAWSEEDRTCVLNQDIDKSIEIMKNNVTLDCRGRNIDGSSGANTGSGVKASYKSSISVMNCKISNFIHGISFVHSDNNNLINNNISNNVNGIILKLCDSNTLTNNIINWNENIGISHHFSSNSTLSRNTISGSQYNFDLYGNNDAHYINYVDKTNFVDGKPIYYLLGVEDQTFDDSTNAGLFYCINCDNITVEDLTFTNSRNNLLFRNTHNSRIENVTVSGNNFGINLMYSTNNIITDSNILNGSYGAYFYFSDYNTITNSNLTNNYYNGIYLRFSNGNTIASNYFSNNISGVYLDKSNGNAITGNSILDNSHYGISISSSNNNIISDNIIFDNYLEGIFIYSFSYPSLSFLNKIQRNTISGNNCGIHLKRTDNSIITDNTISNNKGGVNLYKCSGNKVYHNNFIYNSHQAYSDLNNNFDNGYPDGGNYWSDYVGDDFFRSFFQNWFGSDGIGDTVYALYFNDCQDNYPFMTENGWEEQSQPPKEVPLYTQVRSSYPPRTEEDEWADEDYDQGFNYSCGSTIAKCGCALTSAVMILRYYDVINVNDLDVNPGTLNEWLKNNKGYNSANINWLKVAKYSEYEVKYDIKKSGNYEDNFALLDEYLNKDQPAIVRERIPTKNGGKFDHFIVIDKKLVDIYSVKDPAWYNTKKLNETTTDWLGKIRNYNNKFYGLRLFYPGDGIAMSALSITLASPVEILVTDPSGKKLGKDPTSGIEYNTISDGSYFTENIGDVSEELPPSDHENKALYIENPEDGKYKVEIIGTGSGGYKMGILVYDQNGNSEYIIYEGETTTNNIQEFEFGYSEETVQQVQLYQLVNIDIKPGSEQNSINLESKGVTPVAILSDQFFNAQEINIDSISFAGVGPLKWNIKEVDDDGDLDLMLYFKTQDLSQVLTVTDTEVILTGELIDETNNNILIKGSDSIRIINKHKNK